MATIKTIYLDPHSIEILENMKDKNPDFNFSQFIQDALKNLNQKPKLTYEQILEKQRMFQVKLAEIDGEMNFLEKERRKMDMQMQQERDEKMQKELREEKRQKEKMESSIDNFLYFFDVTRPMAVELAEEFQENKAKETIFEFGKRKGLKDKNEEEKDNEKSSI